MNSVMCRREIVLRSGSAWTNSGRVPAMIAIFTADRLWLDDMVLSGRSYGGRMEGLSDGFCERPEPRSSIRGRPQQELEELDLDRLTLPKRIVHVDILAASPARLSAELAVLPKLIDQLGNPGRVVEGDESANRAGNQRWVDLRLPGRLRRNRGKFGHDDRCTRREGLDRGLC